MANKVDFRLLVISDRKLCKNNSLEEIAEELFRAGVKAFQLREKDLSSSELLLLARRISKAAANHHSKLIINDRLDIAILSKASGIHSPEGGIEAGDAGMFAKRSIIGKSTHSLNSALEAEKEGYDYVLFGPIFRTRSKIQYGKPQGIKALKGVCRRVSIPVFAIGGISPDRARRCIEAGASGAAVIGAILKSKNVQKTVIEFKKALGGL